jgi:hypothetical protein
MNIKSIIFDKVTIKRASEVYIVWHAIVKLYHRYASKMADAVVISRSKSINIQDPPNEECRISHSFIKWELVSFFPWSMKFRCLGAVDGKLEEFEVECEYSLPLKDEA